jgi:hypothetical protein
MRYLWPHNLMLVEAVMPDGMWLLAFPPDPSERLKLPV